MTLVLPEIKAPPNKKIKSWMKKNIFLLLIILGVFLGIILGLLANYMKLSEGTMTIPAFLGELMIRMLNMLILPLVISSTISGLANMNDGASTKIFLYSLLYYLSTTLIASVLATTVATMFMGVDVSNSSMEERNDFVEDLYKNPTVTDSLMDIVRNIFPDNLIGATFQSTKTIYIEVTAKNGSGSLNASNVMMKKSVEHVESPNIIGLIVFSGIFGSIVGKLENKGPFVDFFNTTNQAIMKMIQLVMWYTPFGVMCLLIGQMKNVEILSKVIQMLGWYSATQVVCILVHGLITIPSIYFIFTRKNPLTFYKGILPAIVTAFSTDSSLMTLPITKMSLEENNNIDDRITNFVLPIGTTINMDAATFRMAGMALFVASVNGIHLGVGQLAMICLTSVVASVGVVGLPGTGTGIGILFIVLRSVNLPTESISIVFAVDWILGRFRTMINVVGDCVGCGIVEHICSKNLKSNLEE